MTNEEATAILNEVKDHAVEFELFGIASDYIDIEILKSILVKHIGGEDK